MDQNAKFYIDDCGKTLGPFSGTELLRMMSIGEIEPGILVTSEGWSSWVPLSTLTQPVIPGASAAPSAAPKAPAAKATEENVAGWMHAGRGDWVCAQCGSLTSPVSITEGSLALEILLWLFCLLPGLFYSVWRLTTRHKGCSKCGSRELVPGDSPRAQAILRGAK